LIEERVALKTLQTRGAPVAIRSFRLRLQGLALGLADRLRLEPTARARFTSDRLYFDDEAAFPIPTESDSCGIGSQVRYLRFG
jgi:hypothetical protein